MFVATHAESAFAREDIGTGFGAGHRCGLVVNCIVLYNTIYTQRALDQLKAEGYDIRREDVRRLSPLAFEHITPTGRYHRILPELVRRGEYRPFKTLDAALAVGA